MEINNLKFPLWQISITFFVVLYCLAILTNNPRGVNAETWVIPIIMAVFGFIGAVIGGVLGGIIGLIGKLFKKNTVIPGLKFGATIGFIGLLVIWFLICWMNGSGVCISQ